MVAKIERVYAERVIAEREEVPTGEVAREAIAQLFLRGSIFRAALSRRPASASPCAPSPRSSPSAAIPAGVAWEEPPPTLEQWVAKRLRELGVESGDDLAMLSAADLTMPELPVRGARAARAEFPLVVDVGDATYHADYDLDRSQVMLRTREGQPRYAAAARVSPALCGAAHLRRRPARHRGRARARLSG